MDLREQALAILKEALGAEKAYKVLEYFDSKTKNNYATQKDIYEIKLEIEKIKAELKTEIEKVRAELLTEIEKVRAEIEKVKAELLTEIEKVKAETEKVRAELRTEIEKTKASLIKWSFGFWITQMVILVGILLKLLT